MMRTRSQKVVGFLTSESFLWLGLLLASISSAANHFAPPVKLTSEVIDQPQPRKTLQGKMSDGECQRTQHNISHKASQIHLPISTIDDY